MLMSTIYIRQMCRQAKYGGVRYPHTPYGYTSAGNIFFELASAKAVYDSIILTTFTYCGVLQLKLTITQTKRLSSFHHQCVRIINEISKNPMPIQSVVDAKSIRACKLVRKCLDQGCPTRGPR